MSSFIVDDLTYQNVWNKIEAMRTDRMYGFSYQVSKETLAEWIQELREINVKAVNHRYKENTPMPKKLKFSKSSSGVNMSDMQCFKHLKCIEYQCMEHIDKLPDHLVYLMYLVADRGVLQKLDAYDSAKWG